MASYTMELRRYIESFSQYSSTPLSISEKIEIGRKKLFDFNYPMFDPEYKAVFETNFIRNFYTREIGFETAELFKFNLETWMRINMTYFNKMWESELLDYNPLFNTDLTEDSNRTNEKDKKDIRDTIQTAETIGTSDSLTDQTSSNDVTSSGTTDGTGTDDNFNRKISSDNPDSRLTITTNDGEGAITYASSIDENNENNHNTHHSESTGESHSDSVDKVTASNDTVTNSTADQNDILTSDINEVEDYINHKVGKSGSASYPQLVTEYREALLRNERTIFDEMQQLFMGVY